MKTIEVETSVLNLNRKLETYIDLHSEGKITSGELDVILKGIVMRKIYLAKISTYRELTTYINHVYSLYMNGEISDTEYETTNVIIDYMIAKTF